MVQLVLKEPSFSPYLYINPETNAVHLLLPIMSSTQDGDMEIGLDNTCKSVYSLQAFFGCATSNRQTDALGALRSYQEALKYDLTLPLEESLKKAKASRLEQIETYIDLLSNVLEKESITGALKQAFPQYPKPVERLMSDVKSNLYAIILRPGEQDTFLRSTALAPIFSLPHNGEDARGHRLIRHSQFYQALQAGYHDLRLKAQTKGDILISRVFSKLKDYSLDFKALKALLTEESRIYLGQPIDFNHSEPKHLSPSVKLTQAYVDELAAATKEEPASNEDYITYLVHAAAESLFTLSEDSPFYSTDNRERLSILTQLFLAEVNMVCHIESLSHKNFGEELEQNQALSNSLIKTVRETLRQHDSIEDVLFAWLNLNADIFGLTSPLQSEQQALIKERFALHYKRIQESPHFDEFILLDANKPGLFITHQGAMAVPFVSFVTACELKLSQKEQDFVQAHQDDFNHVSKLKNQLPHKNEAIVKHTEIEVDLKSLKPEELERLYDASSKEIQAEILKAYPALLEEKIFKLFKQFLQHVAYGQQDETKAMLEQHPELTQKLLTAHDIPFTDYSGRTFTCTAYEYAYWACDSHMRWMLEEYILQDEDTRQFIFERVKAMAEPTPEDGSSSSTFFQVSASPKGLHYIQDGKGEQSTHFNFKALINALYDYSINNNTRNSDQCDEAWRTKVGGEQRKVPAHLAQEYCHPHFDLVLENKSLLNEKPFHRKMQFHNRDTDSYDSWFPLKKDSGLGVSFAIIRAGRSCPTAVEGGQIFGCVYELTTVKAIEEVRVTELKQSFERLSQPLSSPRHVS